MFSLKLATALTAFLLLSCATASAENLHERVLRNQKILDEKIDAFVVKNTLDASEAQRVIDVLGDTVLEGDACDRLYKGNLTKRCKTELLDQIRIERKEIDLVAICGASIQHPKACALAINKAPATLIAWYANEYCIKNFSKRNKRLFHSSAEIIDTLEDHGCVND